MFTSWERVTYTEGTSTYVGRVVRATEKKVLIREYDASGELDGRYRYFTGRSDGTLRLRDVPTAKAAVLHHAEETF